MGGHVINTWSTTQSTIALPSGEAELYAITKAACQCMGMASMGLDFGYRLIAGIMTDSSAAMGMVHRRGVGRTRHLDVQFLWIQEKAADKKLKVGNVDTKKNLADLMTNHLQ